MSTEAQNSIFTKENRHFHNENFSTIFCGLRRLLGRLEKEEEKEKEKEDEKQKERTNWKSNIQVRDTNCKMNNKEKKKKNKR